MSIDQKCYDLAKQFMRGRLLPDHSGKMTKPGPEDIQEFAEYIQRAVENFLFDDAEDEA